ncbi:MFS transporter [Actinomyces ruminis]|uniref:Glycoside/pentoside/hexuronide:cation symporter, GPH family n=1 Tax=Actinomyces ruminis TaxID=1937003 RepID=A0ABX4MDH0_9ACTO|nr:MFS transporter [Actinomyces ruminis]PHP53530.1 hypothetical protein BW737_002000 [Actinomyces ruminis]
MTTTPAPDGASAAASPRPTSLAAPVGGSPAKQADPDRVPFGKNLAWNARGLSMAANVLILGYFSLYATDTLGMTPALLGTLMLFSKLFDGVTDLVAGWLIDRTHTRWGRARPYEFAMLGMWLSTWLLFSTPDMSTAGKAVWIFILYTLVNSVFATLANVNQTLYTALAFPTRVAMGKVAAFGGVLISFGAILIAIVVPIGLDWAGKDASRWSTFILGFSLVFLILGMMRFLFVKEIVTQAADTTEKVTFREIFAMLRDNKYIWMLLIVALLSAIASNTGAAAYYYRYIVGNLSMQSVTAGIAVIVVPTVALVPWLMKKFRLTRIIFVGQLLIIVAAGINFAANGNIIPLVIATLVSGLGTLPGTYMIGILLIDCSTYNEWRGHRRLESIMGSVHSFAGKLGAGIAGWIAGLILSSAGYDGSLEVQAAPANMAITVLFAILPGVAALFTAIIYWFFDLDQRLPQINVDLAARRGETAGNGTDSDDAVGQAAAATESEGSLGSLREP